MILTPIRRYGAMILMLLTLVFSSEVLAKTHTTTASQKSHLTKASNNCFLRVCRVPQRTINLNPVCLPVSTL